MADDYDTDAREFIGKYDDVDLGTGVEKSSAGWTAISARASSYGASKLSN